MIHYFSKNNFRVYKHRVCAGYINKNKLCSSLLYELHRRTKILLLHMTDYPKFFSLSFPVVYPVQSFNRKITNKIRRALKIEERKKKEFILSSRTETEIFVYYVRIITMRIKSRESRRKYRSGDCSRKQRL